MINKDELYFAVAKKLVEAHGKSFSAAFHSDHPTLDEWSGYVDDDLESVVKTTVDAVLVELGVTQ